MRLLDTGDEQHLGELLLSSYEFDLHIGPHLIVAVRMNQSGRFCCPGRRFFLGVGSLSVPSLAAAPHGCGLSPHLMVLRLESEDRLVDVMCFHPLWMGMDQSLGF